MKDKKLKAFSLVLLAIGVLLLVGVAVVASRPIASDPEVVMAQKALSALPTLPALAASSSGSRGVLERVRAEADLRHAQNTAPIRKEQTVSKPLLGSLVSFAVGFFCVFLSNPRIPAKSDNAGSAIHAAAKASGKAGGAAETATKSVARSFSEGRSSFGKLKDNDKPRT